MGRAAARLSPARTRPGPSAREPARPPARSTGPRTAGLEPTGAAHPNPAPLASLLPPQATSPSPPFARRGRARIYGSSIIALALTLIHRRKARRSSSW